MADDETMSFISHGENSSDSRIMIPDSPSTKYSPFQNIFPVSLYCPSPFLRPMMICAPRLKPKPIMNRTI